MRPTISLLTIGFIAAMLFSAALRYAEFAATPLTPFAGYATEVYVGATVLFALLLIRAGVGMNRVGFGLGFRLSHLALAAAGVAALQLYAHLGEPVVAGALGASRDLTRFDDVAGSLPALIATLALSWSFAAFGEEIAFRIVMLRSIAASLGDGAAANAIALILQALVFGAIHAYQGATGVVGASASGVIFGALTLAARGAIWPAALAHGANNSIGLLSLYLGD